MSFHRLAVAINALDKGEPIVHEEGGRLVVIPRGWAGSVKEAFFFEVGAGRWPSDFDEERQHPGRYYTIWGINTGVGCREPYIAFKSKKEALAYAINEAKNMG